MKIDIKKYQNYYFTGEWHIHTNYTDGENSIFEYCEIAIKKNIPLLAFTEHVRYNLSYDFEAFLRDIEKAKQLYPDLIILSGCEAKVLPGGKLDCKREVLAKCDYKLFSFHSFPKDLKLYFNSLKKVLLNYPINTWAHPSNFLNKTGMSLKKKELIEVFKLMKDFNILLEINYKYNLPQEEWIYLFNKLVGYDKVVYGGDIHSSEDLLKSILSKSKLNKNLFNIY